MNAREKLRTLNGRRMDLSAIAVLKEAFQLPQSYIEVLSRFAVVGTRLSLSPGEDLSGLGAEIQLMDETQIASEARECYPGITALKRGYVPFGICAEGSGDPYFLRIGDAVVVRIPHDATTEEELDESQIEVVALSFEDLVEKGAFY